jgi:hypothetical protein
MFIHATVDLPIPVASAIDRLHVALARHRLDQVSDDAYQAGLVELTRVGPFGEVAGLSKMVRLELLDPRPIHNGVRLPLRWVATGPAGQLFPALDADLDLTAISEHSSALSISAVYHPPLGVLGAGIDRLLLHRAARATMRALLRGLGRSLTNPSHATTPHPQPRLGPVRFSPT